MPPPPIPSVRRPAPSPRATPRTLLAAALFTGFVFGCVCTAGTVAAVLALSSSPSAGGKGNFLATSLTEKRVYTRAELERLVMGRTFREVRSLLGEPADRVTSEVWRYDRLTVDPKTGKVEEFVMLTTQLRGGGVSFLTYSGDPIQINAPYLPPGR